MTERNKPHIVYTQNIAETYESDRQNNVGDLAFWEKERQELQFGIATSKLDIHTALEAGCGTGRFIPDMVRKGYTLFGFDISPYMLGMASKKSETKQFDCNLIRADLSHIPLSDRKIDFVYSIRVMNQLPSREFALHTITELFRICKTPGAILLEYVNSWSLSRFSFKSSTYLSINDIKSIIREEKGCKLFYVRGVLFFSQTIWTHLPRLLLRPLMKLDSFLCRLLPMFSTRCYVLIRK